MRVKNWVMQYILHNRALHTDGKLSLLYVVDPAINAQWAKIENLIEQEATSEAKKICRNWSQKIKERFKIDSEIIIKIGNRSEEVVKLLNQDQDIRFLVLASAPNSDDPGPIMFLTGKKIKELSIPIVIVPAYKKKISI